MGSSLSYKKRLLQAGTIAIMLCIPAFLMAQDKGSPEALMITADSLYGQGQYTEAARLFNQAAFQYWENESDKKAAEAFEKSLLCNEQIGNKNGKKVILGHLGQLYYEMDNWNQSIRHFENQLAIARQQNRKTDIASVLINLSNVYLASSDISRAIKSLEEASALSAEANHIPLLKNSYALLAQAY
ncbi:MAG: tetratricopeptide repeat protein, partial [Bacteroidales bacterium]|nr:tetratricopeptide repeat protein [Bacteroidales bacterium]